MEPLHVTAVIVNWKTPALVLELLRGLGPSFDRGLRAVVVDNGSGEESVRALQDAVRESAHARAITFIASPRNLGYGNAVNLAAETALAADEPPAYLWLLNPDVHIEPGTLDELRAVANEAGAGIVSAPEGGPGMAGFGRWPRPFYARHQDILVRAPAGARWCATGRCANWCALHDARMVRQLMERDGQFLDGSFFMDWDEWDCSLRARDLGWKVVAALRCGATHDTTPRATGSAPMAPVRQYYQARNGIVVARRHMPAWQFWLLLPVHVARDLSWFARLRAAGKGPHERAYLRGLRDGLRGRLGRWERHPD